ncbi:TPA: helix-turn-helix transcriptional regulator [Enterobacter kobei]|uniref:helix-turn-helix domain-containing protein n=1 Tax=Enterobacter TaxID=547 RepID=UPI0021D185D2|nr:helix-turn-helix transcriptional regulator [Enterobacter quasiroggenkampii]MCU6307708.1 helix-turn-helix transcriptional regulator [Enterobacter quasiroggenkampii]HCT9943493.1 helix-turn-helix transcriptional regulator [Enterobacter kobei]HCT9943779.1 helix-turn-helix transcriptional regulator [Enterobacter kobei]
MKKDERYIMLQNLLITKRKNIGLTQKELAASLGKPQSFISKYETGERRIDVIELIDICRQLNINFIDLLQELE